MSNPLASRIDLITLLYVIQKLEKGAGLEIDVREACIQFVQTMLDTLKGFDLIYHDEKPEFSSLPVQDNVLLVLCPEKLYCADRDKKTLKEVEIEEEDLEALKEACPQNVEHVNYKFSLSWEEEKKKSSYEKDTIYFKWIDENTIKYGFLNHQNDLIRNTLKLTLLEEEFTLQKLNSLKKEILDKTFEAGYTQKKRPIFYLPEKFLAMYFNEKNRPDAFNRVLSSIKKTENKAQTESNENIEILLNALLSSLENKQSKKSFFEKVVHRLKNVYLYVQNWFYKKNKDLIQSSSLPTEIVLSEKEKEKILIQCIPLEYQIIKKEVDAIKEKTNLLEGKSSPSEETQKIKCYISKEKLTLSEEVPNTKPDASEDKSNPSEKIAKTTLKKMKEKCFPSIFSSMDKSREVFYFSRAIEEKSQQSISIKTLKA